MSTNTYEYFNPNLICVVYTFFTMETAGIAGNSYRTITFYCVTF